MTVDAAQGSLKGKQIQPRELAEHSYTLGWTDAANLVTWIATILSESQGFDRAMNDNTAALGTVEAGKVVLNAETYEPMTVVSKTADWVTIRHESGETEKFPPEALVITSRDCGVGQVNIPASQVGTDAEERLYDWRYNLSRCRELYETPINDAGAIRGFGPWFGYTKEIYLRDTYIVRASGGVGNFLGDMLLKRTPTDTLSGEPYVHTLTTPLLNRQYRLEAAVGALGRARTLAGQLKPIGGPLVDAKADEIIHVLAAAQTASKA